MDGNKLFIYICWILFKNGAYSCHDLPVQEIDIPTSGKNDTQVSPPAEDYRHPSIEEGECDHCLCRPCVTSERYQQLWWEEREHAPNRRNSKRRKRNYKRFCVMLPHRGVWKDP